MSVSTFDHPTLIQNINQSLGGLRKAQPEAMQGFGQLAKAAMAEGAVSEKHKELIALATHCTAQEDAAQKVERQVRKSEAALLLHSHIGEIFEGLVTGMDAQGAWVRIFSPPAEGRLLGALPPLKVGQVLRLKLVSTSIERGFLNFSWMH